MFKIFFFENRAVNVEKYGAAREATDDNIIWCMRFACWVSKATRTHAHEHANPPVNSHTRTRTHTHARARTQPRTHVGAHNHRNILYLLPQSYVVRTLPLLLVSLLFSVWFLKLLLVF